MWVLTLALARHPDVGDACRFKHSLPRGPSGRISKERLWEILTSAGRELTTHKHPEVWVVDIGSWLVKK